MKMAKIKTIEKNIEKNKRNIDDIPLLLSLFCYLFILIAARVAIVRLLFSRDIPKFFIYFISIAINLPATC